MAGHLRAALTQVKLRIHSQLPVDIDQLAGEVGHRWRDRKLTPAVTVWLFMLQIVNGNVAMTALRHLGGMAMQASSYCAARQRLPVELFARLFDAVSQAAGVSGAPSAATLLNGRRAGNPLAGRGDVTSFSTPDTPALREHFGYPPGQREGCGFPVGRLLGVLDVISGCVLVALGCPLFTHEAREMLSLHPLLKRGDAGNPLAGRADRGFCSYAQIALLLNHGVDAVLRLHQRRPTQAMKDWIETWTRPLKCPEWMSESMWKLIPATLSVRIVRYTVRGRNGRMHHVYVATTLLDRLAYPATTIERLYGHRWNIETCFNQLKTHAKMNTLKSQTVKGVIKASAVSSAERN